jgi:pimeloyl-ACP methyl ester carboxylesterase
LLLAVVILVLGAVGWYYAGEIKSGAFDIDFAPSEPDLVVTAVGRGQVTLAVTDETDLTYGSWQADGIYRIDWDGGYAQAGPIIKVSADQVTREFTPKTGELTVGQGVNLDGRAFDGDPRQALGIAFEEVTITSGFGDFDAWLVDGEDNRWVIYTHGKGSDRGEALRMLSTVTDLGLPSLVITYRNDEGAPTSDSRGYDYGLTEWEDLEAAVQYALNHGAEDVVLVGYSMGGGITLNLLYESPLADKVAGIILDSPMIDFGDVIHFGGERRDLPGVIINVGKLVATLRLGVDWEALDYLDRVDELDLPILLFHGDEDRTIHKRLSDQFAEARPDIVTYVAVAGAGHVKAWNVDRDRYETALMTFLDDIR